MARALTDHAMKRALLVTSLLAAASTPAVAGSYLGLGIGTSPAISEDSDRLGSDGRSGKVLLGMRFARISLEGGLGAYDVTILDSGQPKPYGETYQLSGAVKLSLPLGNNFEAFGRAGLHHTWIRSKLPDDDRSDVSGDGYLIGAGFEYRLNLLVGQGSLFIDYQVNKAKLEGERFMFDGSSRMWTAGLTVGL